MKLNNKGLSIVELIVSIALISVIMLFLYRLLADVTFQKEDDYFASLNQEQRIEIIDKLETTLSTFAESANASNKIASVTVNSRHIYFKNSSNSVLVDVYVDSVDGAYKRLTLCTGSCNYAANIKNRWIIKGGILDSSPSCSSVVGQGKTLYKCTIKVYTTNVNNKLITHNGKSVNNNNTLDDIVFSVMY